MLQYICTMCGEPYLLYSSLQRHMNTEIPAFMVRNMLRNEKYERSRRSYRKAMGIAKPKLRGHGR